MSQPASPSVRAPLLAAVASLAATFVLCRLLGTWVQAAAAPGLDGPMFVEAVTGDGDRGFLRLDVPLPPTGHVRALVLFTRFRDSPDAPVPTWADGLFDPDRPGSLSHFYAVMSSGQLHVTGQVMPRRYVSRLSKKAYLGQPKGNYRRYVQEVLTAADADVDYALFDNDGDDGIPNSGDDDGTVDYVFIVLLETPKDFIGGGATGIAGLDLNPDFVTQDFGPPKASGRSYPVRVQGHVSKGALIGEGRSAGYLLGTMAHELGHSLGLADYYDLHRPTPEDDSAGIGHWGLMGLGTLGWHGDDGPNPFSGPNLEFLGWAGAGNERVVVVDRDTTALRLRDLHLGGALVKIPLGGVLLPGDVLDEEYLLLEHRVASSHYYNRHQPADGLLVWHVRPQAFHVSPEGRNNSDERRKTIDLVCADGLFEDRGFPRGRRPRPVDGRDNLDFWSTVDAAYPRGHAGNRGDATDPFDGRQFTRLATDTNPSTNFDGRYPVGAATGLSLEGIRRDGDDLIVDLRVPRWRGTIVDTVRWLGHVYVTGDLTVAPGGHLIVHRGARVHVAPQDELRGGRDPERCEIEVQGTLQVDDRPLTFTDRNGRRRRPDDASPWFGSAGDGRWFGLVLADDHPDLPPVRVSDADHGLRWAAELGDAGVATAVAAPAGALPASYELRPNYPNPFNASTTIEFSLAQPGDTQLVVYDALGQRVRSLVDQTLSAGGHSVSWHGRDDGGRAVASGVYLLRLTSGDFTASRRLSLVK